MRVLCYPQLPHPSVFKLGRMLKHLGWEAVPPGHRHDLAIINSNVCWPEERLAYPHAINGKCVDVRKTTVMRAAQEVFGFSCAIDPTAYEGWALKKGERNGGGHVEAVLCPTRPETRTAYCRILSNEKNVAIEHRVAVFNRQSVIATKTFRTTDGRRIPAEFRIDKSSVYDVPIDTVADGDEMAKLLRVLEILGADWCECDLMRDRDGKLYLLDVNPGPGAPSRHSFTDADWEKIIPREAAAFQQSFRPC